MLDLTIRSLPKLMGVMAPDEDADRRLVQRTWRGRMVNEYRSAGVWSVLVRQLMEANVSADLVHGAAQAALDELRHADQCAGCLVALDGEAKSDMDALEPVPEHNDVDRLEAVVRNVMAVGCVSETVAVSLIRAEHVAMNAGPLREVLGQILADEVRHARFGWRALGELLPMLSPEGRERLGLYLVDVLEHQVRYEWPKLSSIEDPSEELAQLGICGQSFARNLFLETVSTVIVPGLQDAGLNAQQAWEAAQRRLGAQAFRGVVGMPAAGAVDEQG